MKMRSIPNSIPIKGHQIFFNGGANAIFQGDRPICYNLGPKDFSKNLYKF